MRKNIFAFFVLLFLFGHRVDAQVNCVYTLKGTIQSDAEFLPGAVILLENGKGAVANERGEFVIENLCVGKFNGKVQHIGFLVYEFTIEIPARAELKIKLAPDVISLEEVVVQDKIKNAEHSQNISQLTQKQLAESSGKSLGESLKEISGVNSIQAGPGVFKPVIHGVHSQRILILNHGIRQEGQQWGAEHAPEIDPFVASSVTVVKDASAIKYGTDALGGVVIVNPAELPETAGLGGSFSAIGQSNGRSGTLSGMLEGGIKNQDGWGWRVQGTGKRAGDFHAPNYQLTNTGLSEVNYSAAVGLHRERYGVEAYFSHFQSTIGILRGTSISSLDDLIVAMESSTPQFTTDFSYTIQEPRQEVSHDLLKLSGHLKTSKGELRFQYGFQNNQRQEFDIRRGSLSNIPSIDLALATHTIETEWETESANRITCLGVTGMIQNNRNIPGTQRIPFIPNFTGISTGAFAITKFTWDKVTLDLGGRYDFRNYDVSGFDFKNSRYESSMLFHNASATGGVTVNLNPRSVFSSNVSSAWRPPHVAELYSLGTHQSAAAIEYGLLLNEMTNEVMDIEDADFKVEQALKWVNTYRYERNEFDVEATFYANYISNYIYLRPAGITQNVRGVYPYFRYTQTDALFLGADVAVGIPLSRNLKLNTKASLLSARDVAQNDYLVFIPSNRYEAGVRYDRVSLFGLQNVYAETKLKRITQQTRTPQTITVREIQEAAEQNVNLFADGNNFDFQSAPQGYWLWNAAIGFSAKTGDSRLDFRVACENMLNTTYREYTNRFRYYADDLGRNFMLSIKYTF